MSDDEVAQALLELYGITLKPVRVEMQTWLVRDADGNEHIAQAHTAVMFDKR
jgi:hypothetical protein